MSRLTVKENLSRFALNRVISFIDGNPDENIIRIVKWLENHDRNGGLKYQIGAVHDALSDSENNWAKLVKSLWIDIDDGVRKSLFENVVVNASMLGSPRQRRNAKKYECNVPWAILMDPTSNCNLHCLGCWAGEYYKQLNLSLEQLDKVVEEGKALGTYVYVLSGGEPLMRKDDIIRLCERHPDCGFLAFTNGTLIDEDFADEMLRVKNFVPAISIEGFEKETDARRGNGTYQKVIKAMEILKEKKLLFGASCCYTSENVESIGSEGFIDHLLEVGCKFAWYFTYMPLGNDAPVHLIASPDQRKYMYHQVRKHRQDKPIFTIDFWNDGEYVAGCIAGGRHYLHINANGDYEPCAFIHYSNYNLKDKSLLEALQSPLFQQYRNYQPFNCNLLRPCPFLDNPDFLVKMVEASGAHSTDMKSPENVRDLTSKARDAAKKWEPVADKLWEDSYRSKLPPRDDIAEQMERLRT